MKIFISWSKEKGKALAKATKQFLENTLGNDIEFFFSPEMYKGTRVDHEIHSNLLDSDKCLVCITSENFKNPWLMYEAGVVYGANYAKSSSGIVIPILFEHVPEWSSWIDKPLNRYVPIQIQDDNGNFSIAKNDFKKFFEQISKEYKIKIKKFEQNWTLYEKSVREILLREQLIPVECRSLVDRLLENDSDFTLTSPEITKEKIFFHKGFTTHALTKILTDNIQNYQGKYLWIYGRKNHNLLMSREYESFFEYLATEGLEKGVDFRCLFVHPKSEAAIKSSSKDRSDIFDYEMHNVLKMAYSLKNKFGLPVEKLFRLYTEPRLESIIRSDNAVLYRHIIRDSDGYPMPYTNSGFEVLSAMNDAKNKNNKGFEAIEKFKSTWNNEEKSIPLTATLLKDLYGENV